MIYSNSVVITSLASCLQYLQKPTTFSLFAYLKELLLHFCILELNQRNFGVILVFFLTKTCLSLNIILLMKNQNLIYFIQI